MASISWRTGVNMREFAYYDKPECRIYQGAVPPTREAQIAALKNLRVAVVRFFAVHRKLSVEANLTQVGLALDLLQQNNMQAVVCIGDSLWDSGFTIPGDDQYHQGTPNGHINKRYWHGLNYQENYLPYVRSLLTRFGAHPAVLAWELGNEFAIQPQPSTSDDFNAFVQFVVTASHEIKLRSPSKFVSVGLINTNQVAPGGDDAARTAYATQLYSIPDVDLISLHVYQENAEDNLAMIDVGVAKSLNKQFFVGELGADFGRNPDRTSFVQQSMQTWKTRAAFTTLLWAFDDSPYPPDSGVADSEGFARRYRDYTSVMNQLSNFFAPSQPVSADVIAAGNLRSDHAPGIDKLQWLKDISILDWSKVEPNANLGDKTWLVRNVGTTIWGTGYVLAHDNGDPMGAPDSVTLPPLAPNQQGEVIVPSIVAPAAEGIHRANWMPRNTAGKAFLSNLTIVIDVDPAGGGIPAQAVVDVAQQLSSYGITFIPDNWTADEAQRVRDVIVQVAERLYNFALNQVPAAVLNSPQDVFRRFFPRRVLRRNPDKYKYFNCQNPQDPKTCSKAYAWNDGTTITFYSAAIFSGTQKVTNQSPVKHFTVTYTTEFLILHELSHSHPWADDYAETSQPLVGIVAKVLPNHKRYQVESATIASAGFKRAARSQNNNAEFSTDAIANWCQKSFTAPADGDTEGFGNFRQAQMDAMVNNWLSATYGPIPH